MHPQRFQLSSKLALEKILERRPAFSYLLNQSFISIEKICVRILSNISLSFLWTVTMFIWVRIKTESCGFVRITLVWVVYQIGTFSFSFYMFPDFRFNIIVCYPDPDNTRISWFVQRAAYSRGSSVEHVCVNHGCSNIFVAEQFLHGADVVTVLQ